jgi:hypothetical protein
MNKLDLNMKIMLENRNGDRILDGKTLELKLSLRDNSIMIETSGEKETAAVSLELVEGHLDMLAWNGKADMGDDPTVSQRLLENIYGEDNEEWQDHDSRDQRGGALDFPLPASA